MTPVALVFAVMTFLAVHPGSLPLVAQEQLSLGPGDILGEDFVSGASAADLAGYVTPFLSSGRYFEITSQWAEGTFVVRDTDANGYPLLGPSSSGSVDGALIAYRLGLRTPELYGISLFGLADYFVASHLDSFFDLLTPSKVTPGNHLTGGEWNTGYRGLYYLSWLVPIGLADGGGLTGFSARAYQILPGISLTIPVIGLGLQAGLIFRYRDPIDEDGRFISRHYLQKYPSDYSSADDIPDGVQGEQSSDVFLAAQLFGVEADLLLTPRGAPAYVSLARNFAMFMPDHWAVQRLVPQLEYFDALSQNARDRSIINPSVELTVERELRGRPLTLSPGVAWFHDPVAFQAATLELGYRGFVLGGSFQDHPEIGALPGVRFGYAPVAAGIEWLVADVRYNYLGGAVGALEIIDRPIFTLEVRF